MSTVSGALPLGLSLHDVPEKFEDCPSIADLHLTSPRSLVQNHNSSPPAIMESRVSGPSRPQSPTDAILITRGMSANRSSPEDNTRYVLSRIFFCSNLFNTLITATIRFRCFGHYIYAQTSTMAERLLVLQPPLFLSRSRNTIARRLCHCHYAPKAQPPHNSSSFCDALGLLVAAVFPSRFYCSLPSIVRQS